MNQETLDKLTKAGNIAKQVKEFIIPKIKPNTPLLDIANQIESKIIELGGKPAFPVNLSINEVAAHDTPKHDDDRVAEGLLKVDLGVHISGYIADTAISIDLENSEENQNLIKAAALALRKATELVHLKIPLNKLGETIEKEITNHRAQPVRNLSGHSIDQYELHAGTTIPNHDNSSQEEIEEGVYAIEPFTTLETGSGAVRDGKLSGIYHLEKLEGNVRDPFARQVLQFIKEEYQTLPFCQRWLVKQFGTRALLALRFLEQANFLHHYPQLIERSGSKVAQAEHTIIITEKEKIITT
jgi:methionyl aminopeptidase